MDYTDITAEELLLNDSFLNYCLGASENDVQFWTEWLQANPHKKGEVDKAKELYNILNGNLLSRLDQDQADFKTLFQDHLTDSRQQQAPVVSFRRKVYIATSIAAAIVLAVFIIQWPTTGKKQLQPAILYSQVSEPGEKKLFQLPDGSQIHLNSGSSVEVIKGFNEITREIILEGEAFFEIVHNEKRPFIIHTKWMDVRVLGTVFNVKAYPSDLAAETSLISGSIEVVVKNHENKKVILKPHEKLTVLTQSPDQSPGVNQQRVPKALKPVEFTVTPFDSSLLEISWMKNQLVFENETFEHIASELERNYNIQIVFENEEIKHHRYTATFDKKTILQILDALKLSRSFNYEVINDQKIVIRK